MDSTTPIDNTLASHKHQWAATLIANVICLAMGSAIGWLSPTLPQLYSPLETPLLDGAISEAQAGWIGSLVSIGGVIGTFSMGMLTQVLGTQLALLLCAGPLLVSWLLVYLSQLVWHLYVARLLLGFCCGGVFICNALFVAEIASHSIRGRLSALLQASFTSGVLLGMIGGTFLHFRTVPLVMAAMPVLFIALFALMPATPQHLLRANRHQEAEKSLRFYRNTLKTDKMQELQLQQELGQLKAAAEQNNDVPLVLADFLTRDAIRGLIIGPTLMAVNQFSGTFTICNYASSIFSASGSNIDPNICAIVVGCLQIVGTGCASLLMDRWGRKRLLLISTIGCTLTLSVTGTYSYVAKHAQHLGIDVNDFNWVPVCSLAVFIFVAAVGIVPVPYVMTAEILPANIRKIGATICTCSVSCFSFTILKCFPSMLATLELHGCVAIFAAVSLFGVFFTVFVVPETSGRNLDELGEKQQPRRESLEGYTNAGYK